MKKRPQFVNGEIYHIVIKAVDEGVVFRDTDDRYRAVFGLFELNDSKSVVIRDRRRARFWAKKFGHENFAADRDLLVEILAFKFMTNHIHLLLRQLKDNGISDFMKKYDGGYAGYYNRKYGRGGHLFRDRFSAIHIKTTKQLINVFVYIHTNALSLIESNWKEFGISDSEKAIKFLENYKWSSYPDYIGKKNFPSVTQRDTLLKIFGSEKKCKEFVDAWIKYKTKDKKWLQDFQDVELE